MISKPTFQQLSTQLQTTELNIRREYLQHLFLSYFYQQKFASKCFFKGGTALRIVFGSPRFSEDLDFSTTRHRVAELENCIVDTLAEIERAGIKTSITESKKTTGGYLLEIRFLLDKLPISILLQFSQRSKNDTGEVVTIINSFVPSYSVVILDRSHLVSEKIQALLNRSKPRDFYDLYFLLRANLTGLEHIPMLSTTRDLVSATKLNFERELKVFLPKTHWPIIRDFKKNLLKELSRFK